MNWWCVLASCLWASVRLRSACAQPGPGGSCLCFQELGHAGELYQAPSIENARDGSNRLFFSESRGFIWIFLPDGSRLPNPFLDMSDTDIHVSGNTGLYGVTFHPDFVNNQRFYLHYGAQYNGTIYQRISEMAVSSGDPNVADPSSERILIDVFYGQIEGHVGGAIEFGDDGYLYFGIGDMMCCSDPFEMGQNKSTYHGAVHRIDVNTRTGDLSYGIPPDNPFLDEPDTVPEMFAFGFRQPYTSSVDTGDRNTGAGKGRIFVGDVGEGSFEEVDVIESGGNYGWSVWEGALCHDPQLCNETGPVVSPIVAYNRSMGSCVLVGGVYRGCMNPDLDGWLIFMDYGSGKFFGAAEAGDNDWRYVEIPKCGSCPGNLTNIHQRFAISMGSDEDGEYYFNAVDSPGPNNIGGSLYKIIDLNNQGVPCS